MFCLSIFHFPALPLKCKQSLYDGSFSLPYRREGWPGYSTYTCWQTLLASTKRESKDHAILSDLYNTTMSNRFNDLMDDIQRIYKRVSGNSDGCYKPTDTVDSLLCDPSP